MDITQFSMEEIKDPTNIIEGKRFEFLIDVEVDEEDELYTPAGLEVRAIIGQLDEAVRLVSYFIIDKSTNEYLDFALEEDEEQMIVAFCAEQLAAEATQSDVQ